MDADSSDAWPSPSDVAAMAAIGRQMQSAHIQRLIREAIGWRRSQIEALRQLPHPAPVTSVDLVQSILAQQQFSKEIQSSMLRSLVPAMNHVAEVNRTLVDAWRETALLGITRHLRFGTSLDPAVTGALGVLSSLVSIGDAPTAEDLNAVADLLDSGEVATDNLRAVDEALSADQQAADAVSKATDELSRAYPELDRDQARLVLVGWVYLTCVSALLWVAVAAPPLAGMIFGALGLGATQAAKVAGKAFDRAFPDESEADPPAQG